MKGTLSIFDRDVVPLRGDGISEVEQCHSALRSIHSQAVVDAQSNFVPNRVLGTTPPELSSFECYLSRSIHTTLAQLRSGHCRLLNSYKARITAGVTDVCPDCGVAPHSVNICSSALHAWHNWQLKIYGTIRRCGWFSQARRQSDKRRGAVGYSNSSCIFALLRFLDDLRWGHWNYWSVLIIFWEWFWVGLEWDSVRCLLLNYLQWHQGPGPYITLGLCTTSSPVLSVATQPALWWNGVQISEILFQF